LLNYHSWKHESGERTTVIYTTIDTPVQAIHHIIVQNSTSGEPFYEYRNFHYDFNPVVEDEEFEVSVIAITSGLLCQP
jgi:hypothetical protein